jgi:phage terminase small subunit
MTTGKVPKAKVPKAKKAKAKAKPQGKTQSKAKAAARPARPTPAIVPEIVEPCGSSGSKCGIEDESGIDLKSQLTGKELRFIELYLSGNHTIDSALISVGYAGYHPNSLYRIGRRIVRKYESLAGDHRKIMREMGYGETKAIEMLIDSATNAKSEMVRLNARSTLAKCLGLHQDVVAVNQGIQIVIKGRGEDSGKPAVQVQREPAKVLPRAMAITK